MTQIKKTLSIAGIIALATAPAMAEIASTQYVQNIVNNMIPKTGTVGHVLKKTATGLEWAAAPTPTLETTTGTSTTASMTQKAITDALDKKIENKATDTLSFAIGNGATASKGETGWDEYDNPTGWAGSIAIGDNAESSDIGIAIGEGASSSFFSIAIGNDAYSSEGGVAINGHASNGIAISGRANGGGIAIGGEAEGDRAVAIGGEADGYGALAIGDQAKTLQDYAMQLGPGENKEAHTLQVGLGEDYEGEYIYYPLLVSGGTIPAGRLTGGEYDGGDYVFYDNNGVSGQLLQTNGDGTMSWVDAPAPSLTSILPAQPNTCKASTGQKCALVTTWDGSKYTYDWEVVKVNQ